MELTNNHRDDAYETINAVKSFLYDSPISGRRLQGIAKKFNFDSAELYKKYAILVGDIILGFYKIEDTVPLLQQELGLDARTAALLGADVLDFLAPLSDPNFIVPVDNSDDYMPVITEDPAVIIPAASYAAVQNQTYAPVATTPTLHTMATDASLVRASYQPIAQPEPTYSSEQPIIRKPLSDIPSYANGAAPQDHSSAAIPPIEPPRWGS